MTAVVLEILAIAALVVINGLLSMSEAAVIAACQADLARPSDAFQRVNRYIRTSWSSLRASR